MTPSGSLFAQHLIRSSLPTVVFLISIQLSRYGSCLYSSFLHSLHISGRSTKEFFPSISLQEMVCPNIYVNLIRKLQRLPRDGGLDSSTCHLPLPNTVPRPSNALLFCFGGSVQKIKRSHSPSSSFCFVIFFLLILLALSPLQLSSFHTFNFISSLGP